MWLSLFFLLHSQTKMLTDVSYNIASTSNAFYQETKLASKETSSSKIDTKKCGIKRRRSQTPTISNTSKKRISISSESATSRETAEMFELSVAMKKIEAYKIPKIDPHSEKIEESSALSKAIVKLNSLDILKFDSDENEKNEGGISFDDMLKVNEEDFLDQDDIWEELSNIESDGYEFGDNQEPMNCEPEMEDNTTSNYTLEGVDNFFSNNGDTINIGTGEKIKMQPQNTTDNQPEKNDTDTPSTNLNSNDKLEPISSKTATIINSLLENDDDNPEKILEGLMSVLGSEKLKKMQELLLKKTLPEIENEESNDRKLEVVHSESEPVDFEKSMENIKDSSCEIKQGVMRETNQNEANSAIDTSSDSINDTVNQISTDIPKESDSNHVDKDQPSSTNELSPFKSSALCSANGTETSPSKPKRKKGRKLNELDRLHRDLLRAHDFEDIMRASVQPRVSVKPKIYEDKSFVQIKTTDSNLPGKHFETKPLTIKLLRLNLGREDMPVIVNDEFFSVHFDITARKSKPGPKSKKKILPERETESLPMEVEIKPEPVELSVMTEKNIQEDIIPKQVIQSEKATVLKRKSDGCVNKKKRRSKNPLWSKGILKKRKKFQVLRPSEWEDIDSSDESELGKIETTVKMSIFKDMLNGFAIKVGFKSTMKKKTKKIKESLNMDKSLPEEHFKDEKPAQMISDSNPSESFKILNLPKRINLPLQNNMLNIISDKFVTVKEAQKITTIPISNVKPPVTEKPKLSDLPSIQSEAVAPSIKRPIELNATFLQSTTQNIVVVKPISRETDSVKVRTLSAREQEALKAALTGCKPKIAAALGQNNIVDKLATKHPFLSISKVSASNSTLDKTAAQVTRNDPIIVSNPMNLNLNTTASKVPIIEGISIGHTKKINTSSLVDAIQGKNKKPIDTPVHVSVPVAVEDKKVENESEIEEILDCNDEVEEVISLSPEVEVVDLIDDDDDDVIDSLRPWIEKPEFKSKKLEHECIKMINNPDCLVALFKCMGSTCSFYSNSKDIFQLHLELHREHQPADSSNFLLCCYCNFRPNSIGLLVTHLETAHGYAKYGCTYCFFRSVNEYQVTANHHMNYHRYKEKSVLVFEPKKFKNENTEKNYISETLSKVVPAFLCPCKYCFRVSLNFLRNFLDLKILTILIFFLGRLQNRLLYHKSFRVSCPKP